jgi:hypothetical protein
MRGLHQGVPRGEILWVPLLKQLRRQRAGM